MKRFIFLGLIIVLIIGSCTQEKKSPIEGAWKLVYGTAITKEQTFTFPDQFPWETIKILTKGHMIFIGQIKLPTDTVFKPQYGWANYTLNGNKFEEIVKFHYVKGAIGSTIRMLMEVRNDTLIQKWPTDENWKLPEKYETQIYVRLD